MRYWLFKSEASTWSWEQQLSRGDAGEEWDGVRNYQARNMIRDEMQKGDLVLFYHSNCDRPGVVGIAEVVREGYPDHTAFDPDDKHYDPKSDPDSPRWFMVDLRYRKKLRRCISLQELKEHSRGKLQGFALLRKGNRLSVMPVTRQQWDFVTGLE